MFEEDLALNYPTTVDMPLNKDIKLLSEILDSFGFRNLSKSLHILKFILVYQYNNVGIIYVSISTSL